MKNRELISKFISTEGYKRNSKDKNNPINIIPSNNITMQDVEFPVEGTDNLGNTQVMYPGFDYTFPGDYVVEKKFQQGGAAWLNGLDTKNINYLNNDSYTKAQIAKKNKEDAAKKASTQKAVSKIPAAKIPADRREAEIMIANGDIKVETIAEIKEREAREAEEAKRAREANLKAYETRVNTPGYSPITGLPNESFTTMLANEAAPLADKFRISNENNFFDDYINPAVWIGSMAKSLGEAPKQSQETGSILPYVTSIGMPLVAGALGGIGAKNTREFVNNMINPLAGFKSEIDWSNWNKEIPDNVSLIKEYNTIEQTSKANGTWMKYSDGSDFNGTPEQFVQMKHPNTQKWAGGAEEAEALYKNRLYRGAHQHIVDFKNRDRKDFATFLTDNKRNAETYATADGLEKRYFDPNIDDPDDWTDGLYELGFPQNLPTIEGQGANNTFRFLDHNTKVDPSYLSASHNRANFKTDLTYAKEYQYNYPKDFDIVNNYLSTDDYAKYVKNRNNPEVIAKINNVRDQMGFAKDIPANTVYAVDAERVSLKSLRHNNGMFDMTNPNIYKGLIPAGVVGTAVAKQEYKQGGEMNKLKKYPAGGPVTPENPPAASPSFSFDNTMQEMYAEDMYNKYGRFIITDKGTAKTYYGTKDDNGQWQVNIIENVLGEGSKDPNNQILDLSKHSSFEKYATSKPKDYVTPTGYYDLSKAKTYVDPDQGFSYTKNMNHPGDNALMMIGTGSALVDLYHNGEMYKERLKAYNNNTPEDNYLSHGCINCKKAGIEDLYNFYNSGEPVPSFIFDSRISPEENMKYAEINNPKTFGRESRNQVMFKVDPINPINENFDLRRFIRDDNIQKIKPRLDALVDISKGGDEMTYTDYESIYNKRPVEEGIEKIAGKQATLDIPFNKEIEVPNKSEQLTSIQGKKGNISIPENNEMKNKPMPQLNQKEFIKEKQKMLKEKGLYTGEIDGIWGVKSEAAWKKYTGHSSGGSEEVREFQRTMNKEYNANLKEDGIWGPKTQEAWRKYNKKQEGGVINPELAEYYSENRLIKHQNGGIHNSLVTANSLGNYNSHMWQLPNTGFLGNLKLASGLISGLSGSALGFMGLGTKKSSFTDYDSDPKQYYQTEDKPINYNTIDNNPIMYAKDGGVMQLGGVAALSTALPLLGVEFTPPSLLEPMATSAMNLTSILGKDLSTDKQMPRPAKISNNPMFGSNSGIGSLMGQNMFNENLKNIIQGLPEPVVNEKNDNNPLSKFLGNIKNKGMFSNKVKPSGEEIAFNSIAGLGMANDVLTQKEFEKMNYTDKIRSANNTMERYQTVNPDNPYGNYTLNAGIGPNFALNKVGAIQDFGTGMSMAKHGGEFKEGGEYYLSEEEIQKLIDEGADIEFIK